MIINHNIPAMGAHRNLTVNGWQGDKDMEKLSSGMRINRGADDAAGLAVSEKMRAQIRGYSMARRNTQDGISLIQTAEGFLQETTSALQRIRELSVQSANGVYTAEDRKQIQTEVSQLLNEIDRVAEQSEFNQLKLFNGEFASPTRLNDGSQPTVANPPDPATLGESSAGTGVVIHVGPNQYQSVSVHIDPMSGRDLGLTGEAPDGFKVDVTTLDNANKSIIAVDKALATVNKQRTDLGAVQNRLETALRGIEVATENLQSAESRVRDTDMAEQMIAFVKDSILTQAATSMLAQANLRPQLILRVLG
jgi:flagellin